MNWLELMRRTRKMTNILQVKL
ncbi:hypothetical protein V389_02530, partial [Staphylococcus aureus T35596]